MEDASRARLRPRHDAYLVDPSKTAHEQAICVRVRACPIV
jgi:hypothetical protein